MIKGKDNSLLVEFDFVVDLDLAMFKFVREKYYKSKEVHKQFISLRDENLIIYNMLNRSHENPLEYLFPNNDTSEMYNELLTNPEWYKKLLSYATAYDTFGLMITFLREASSVSIDVLCKNEIENEFIKNLNPIMPTVVSSKQDIDLTDYTALYIKYYSNASDYNGLTGKHIYIPAARFNMEPGEDMVNMDFVSQFGEENLIHLIDLYRKVKYRFLSRKVDNNGHVIETNTTKREEDN